MLDGYSFSEMLKLFAPLILVELILIIVGIRSLVKDEVNYLPKWAWALIICFINLIGPIIYLVIGRRKD